MNPRRPRPERGFFGLPFETYGRSELGAPLVYFPAQNPASTGAGLVLAGTHGDEAAAIVSLSCALRTLSPGALRHHVVLTANPDGSQLGLRCNGRGVDINRNFPTATWQAGGTVYRWNSMADERDVRLATGESGGSEAETRALCALIDQLMPVWVVSIHEPLACIDDPDESPLGHWLSQQLSLPLVSDVGYAVHGSFGGWCKERGLPCITIEYPPISADAASEDYLEALMALLCYDQ